MVALHLKNWEVTQTSVTLQSGGEGTFWKGHVKDCFTFWLVILSIKGVTEEYSEFETCAHEKDM